MAVKKKSTKKTKRIDSKNIMAGRAYITAGFNNTLITVTDKDGNTIVSGSSGRVGFKGSRRATPYAATKAAEQVASEASKHGLRDIDVIVKGPGLGRISAIKALKSAGLNVVSISDRTALPHNGCRAKKKRRV